MTNGEMMDKKDFNDGLLGFLDASPTPFHATQNMAAMFSNAGFEELKESSKWNLKEGERYYVTRNDSSIIAFTYPKGEKNYTMLGAHTDSPNFRLKPNPVLKAHGSSKLMVEPYGGILLNPWFDRDLSVAGRISYLNANGEIKDALIDAKKAIAIIPSLAIHLDEFANKDRTINKQTHTCPILSSTEDFDYDEFLKSELFKAGVVDVKDILATELSLYDVQKASLLGLNDDYVSSARLDNLLSCYVGMLSICSIEDDRAMLFIASDHEEVGSASLSGAAGSFLEDTLRRVFCNYEEFLQMIRGSIMISCDNAHAIHPNYPDKHDQNHAPKINKGVVIKVNTNQRYASSSTSISKFKSVASRLNEPTQYFVARSDMGCGSTIGPITATRLGLNTLDIGLPTYAMHSIRELAGSADAHSLYKILVEYR